MSENKKQGWLSRLFGGRKEQEKVKQEKAEQEKAEQEKAEQEKAEREKAEQEKAEQEKTEQEKAEQEKAEQEKAEQEKAEQEKAEREKAEQEKAEQEKAEQEKTEQEKAEQEKAEQEKAEREKAEQEKAEREKAEQEKAEQEKTEQEKAEQEKAEQEKAEREKAEQEKAEREKAEQEKAEQEKAEQEKAEREKAEQEKAEQEKVEQEKAEREKAEQEKAEREKAEQEKAEQEKAEQKKVEQGKSEQEKEAPSPPKKKGFFARLRTQLTKTRESLTSGFSDLFLGKKEIDEEILEELETRLLLADVGINVTEKMLEKIRADVSRQSLSNSKELFSSLRTNMESILSSVEAPLILDDKSPYIILMIGVNGVGKTTTIGKLAKQFQAQGKSVMLAAGDTFRAAAVEQLQVWGERNNIPVISQKEGADPASVVFDAVESAKARKIDVLIADTAGRLHTDSGLMQELAKIHRVIKRLDETAPHEVMLVVDASTGQNALNQARQFNATVPLSGITFTKMDGTAKGGIIFAIADELNIPVRYIGVGEGIDDLRPFKAKEFVDALIGEKS